MSPSTFSLCVALSVAGAGLPAMATEAADEREALARLAHELAALAPLVDAAEAEAVHTSPWALLLLVLARGYMYQESPV